MTGTPEPATGRWPPSARFGVPDAEPLPPGQPESEPLPALLADVAADVSGLMRAELLLGRAEAIDNARALAGSGLRFGAGLLMLFLAVTFATVAMVVALAAAIGLIWALVVVTGLCLIVSAMLISAGRRAVIGWRLLPEDTIARVAGDLERLSERAAARRTRRDAEGKEPVHHG